MARGVVRASAGAAPRRGHAVVLGSGLLDDVPLATRAGAFERVSLVDTVHPWPAWLLPRRHPHVGLRTAEISAGLAGDWAELCADADRIVSAKLLSQLPIVPLDAYAARGCAAPSYLARHLIETHRAALDVLARVAERG